MRSRTSTHRSPVQSVTRAPGLSPLAVVEDALRVAGSSAAAHGHHFGGVAVAPVMIQRKEGDEAAPAPSPQTAPPDTAAADTATPESAGTDSSTTTVKAPPTVIHDVYSAATLQEVAAMLPTEPGSASFDIAASTEGDPISKATVTVTQEVHLPKWVERDRQCVAVQTAWDNFYNALKLHEDGHLAINGEKFAKAHTRYKGKSSAATQTVTDEIKKAAKTAGDEFDDKTKHGVTATPPTIIDLGAHCPDAGHAEAEGAAAGTVQAELAVSQPGDPFELEADRIADQVMRMEDPASGSSVRIGDSAASLQRCAACDAEEKDKKDEDEPVTGQPPVLKRKADGPGLAAPPEAIAAARSGGQPLDPATRAFMEPRFGFDFGSVRIHADAEGADAARSVNAHAYTLGSDLVFAEGRYAPGTAAGRRLLAHELTHVTQQIGGTLARDKESPAAETPAGKVVTALRGALAGTTNEARDRVLRACVDASGRFDEVVTAWKEDSKGGDLLQAAERLSSQGMADAARVYAYLKFGQLRLADKLFFAGIGAGTDKETIWRLLPAIHHDAGATNQAFTAAYCRAQPRWILRGVRGAGPARWQQERHRRLPRLGG